MVWQRRRGKIGGSGCALPAEDAVTKGVSDPTNDGTADRPTVDDELQLQPPRRKQMYHKSKSFSLQYPLCTPTTRIIRFERFSSFDRAKKKKKKHREAQPRKFNCGIPETDRRTGFLNHCGRLPGRLLSYTSNLAVVYRVFLGSASRTVFIPRSMTEIVLFAVARFFSQSRLPHLPRERERRDKAGIFEPLVQKKPGRHVDACVCFGGRGKLGRTDDHLERQTDRRADTRSTMSVQDSRPSPSPSSSGSAQAGARLSLVNRPKAVLFPSFSLFAAWGRASLGFVCRRWQRLGSGFDPFFQVEDVSPWMREMTEKRTGDSEKGLCFLCEKGFRAHPSAHAFLNGRRESFLRKALAVTAGWVAFLALCCVGYVGGSFSPSSVVKKERLQLLTHLYSLFRFAFPSTFYPPIFVAP